MLILRWYIARVHQPHEPSGNDRLIKTENIPETRVDVQIDISTGELERACEGDLARLRTFNDDMDNWRADVQIEGWTYANILFAALVEQNVVESDALPVQQRTIAEDMVVLQCFVDSKGVLDYIENQPVSVDPNLDWLIIETPNARWLDFTIPARRMAKDVYRNLLASHDTDEREAF